MSSGKSSPPSAVEAGFFAGGGLEEQLKTYRRKQVRHFRHIVTITLFFAAVIWFLSGLVDQARYEFQVAPVPTAIGDVIEVGAKVLPHNAYISLEGITEHRGLSQAIMRDLSLNRQEYWYFRLLGSGGIFIEVPPDEDVYGIATKVAVSGRVVDPTKDSTYQRLLEVYHDRFLGEADTVRIIQVGRVPGEAQTGFIVAIVVLVLLVIFNLFSLKGLLQARKNMATGMVG
ncbi:MAG: hypothetical protein HOI23_01860 [Deltaproteobacteria bacterium]|nr:hypothetical protein [Deltaproteobacteria bacterium]MBT6431595.1 hypothetical protein [Deltaproteobacteria bacterium]MBT6492218.1 hypothetical protein [Deltaproteobacteria bacterium]